MLRPSGLKLGLELLLPRPLVMRRGASFSNAGTAKRSMPSFPEANTSVLPSGEKAGVMFEPPRSGIRREEPLIRSRTLMCVPSFERSI